MTLRVTFLGTSGAVPTVERAPSAVHVNREGESLLFDCGEGTQRQMMRFDTGFDISHVFVTHLHGDHVLGLPGLIQSMDFNGRDAPLAIHGPPGSRRELRSLVHAVGNDPTFPVRIVENTADSVALSAEEFEVRTFETEHRTTSVGYAIVEDDRKGRFDRQTAEEELGIPPGPKYGRLHDGQAVEHDGRTVQPEEVVGDPRPGRTVVYTGDTRPVPATERAAESADLLIHDSTFAHEAVDRARSTGHASAREAAELAERAGVRRLALTHISSRYARDADRLVDEAEAVFDGEVVLPDDGDRIEVSFPE
ncbi:ribonuclease Z [Halobaculum sp. MBLA0143]|uniref:ribonuclease Z n=1 Tax=Halobaculum sp. MBLA0143 TaxID=3079933 RepID=UPI00352395F0